MQKGQKGCFKCKFWRIAGKGGKISFLRGGGKGNIVVGPIFKSLILRSNNYV